MKKSNSNHNIAIVGGGITGLFCGYFLSKKGYKITIFEKTSSPGGLLGTLKLGDNMHVDKLYHHIFFQDKALISFLKTAGLAKELVWHDNLTALIANNRHYALNSISDLFKIENVSLTDKCKFLFFVFRMLTTTNWERWDKISIFQLISTYCGTKAWRNIYYPLLRAKFGNAAPDISGAWAHNKIKQRLKCRRSQKGERLATFKNSHKVLIDYLSKKILKKNGAIFTNSCVQKILINDSHFGGISVNDKIYSFDSLIVTIPLPELLVILPSSLKNKDKTIQKLSQIEYAHSLCIIVRLKKPLSKFYFTVIDAIKSPFSVIIQQANIADSSNHNQEHIAYLGNYVFLQKTLFAKTDEELFHDYFIYLRKLFPSVTEDHMIDYHVIRSPYAQPLFKTNFADLKPNFKTSVRGMYLVNMSQLFPMSRCVNNNLMLSKQFVEKHF